jgi:hypothetical protein
VKDSRRQGSPEATGGLRLDAKDRERLNVLVKEMFRPAELVERIRRLVHHVDASDVRKREYFRRQPVGGLASSAWPGGRPVPAY